MPCARAFRIGRHSEGSARLWWTEASGRTRRAALLPRQASGGGERRRRGALNPRSRRSGASNQVKVAFPHRRCRRQGGQANHDRVTASQRLQRLAAFPHPSEHIRDLRVRHREIALPAGVAGVGLRQAVSNREAIAVRTSSAPARSPCATCTSPTLLYDTAEIALPAGVAGIGLRQAVDDREAVAVRLQRAGQVALGDLHVPTYVCDA